VNGAAGLGRTAEWLAQYQDGRQTYAFIWERRLLCGWLGSGYVAGRHARRYKGGSPLCLACCKHQQRGMAGRRCSRRRRYRGERLAAALRLASRIAKPPSLGCPKRIWLDCGRRAAYGLWHLPVYSPFLLPACFDGGLTFSAQNPRRLPAGERSIYPLFSCAGMLQHCSTFYLPPHTCMICLLSRVGLCSSLPFCPLVVACCIGSGRACVRSSLSSR